MPLGVDEVVSTPTKGGDILSIYLYQDLYWFSWITDVDTVLTPTPNDSWKRAYFTENGNFRVTDSTVSIMGGTNYPENWYNPSPPAPTLPLVCSTSSITYSTGSGTVSNQANSNTVIGVGTKFLTDFTVGASIKMPATGTDQVTAEVMQINSDTVMLTKSSITAAHSAASYQIIPYVNPTLDNTRYYTYTYVNAYGDEGPPCPNLSNKVEWIDGETVSLSTAETRPGGPYNLVAVNVYRTNTTASGSSQYQLVYQADISMLGNLPVDDVASAALGEVLQTLEWDGPPSGVTGLIALPNEGLAAYSGNTLLLSVPGYPHAWPVSYQKAMERPIMGLAAWGTTVVVLTTGVPYAVIFTDPSNSVPEKIETGYSCASKRGVVDMGEFWIYPSPEGLVGIGQGMNKLLTESIFTREAWQAAYQPDTINSFMWEGKYIGFYGNVRSHSTSHAGFMFDIKTGDFIDLDFYATAGYRNPATGILYLMVGSNIVSFATNQATTRTINSLSKRNIFKPTVLTAIKVLSTTYPVNVDIIYPKTGQTISVVATSEAPQRMPLPSTLIDTMDVRVYGANGASVIYLASSIEELPQ
jgi:hypothetical protein